MPAPDDALRSHVLAAIDARTAHADLDAVVRDWPDALRGVRPEGLPYSAWELVEHMRLAAEDIAAFCRDECYTEPDWPDDYWPARKAPPSDAAWHASLLALHDALDAVRTMVRTTDDLYAEIPHGNGQTYLREALLVADHQAYHVGQLVTVRRLLGAWPPDED